ncbi:MAG: hypothetical protein IT350_11660, partial [Deltaproteobacteria bacterium]|nr:hypothetical protein [Deltaproteobacteria bacterium]
MNVLGDKSTILLRAIVEIFMYFAIGCFSSRAFAGENSTHYVAPYIASEMLTTCKSDLDPTAECSAVCVPEDGSHEFSSIGEKNDADFWYKNTNAGANNSVPSYQAVINHLDARILNVARWDKSVLESSESMSRIIAGSGTQSGCDNLEARARVDVSFQPTGVTPFDYDRKKCGGYALLYNPATQSAFETEELCLEATGNFNCVPDEDEAAIGTSERYKRMLRSFDGFSMESVEGYAQPIIVKSLGACATWVTSVAGCAADKIIVVPMPTHWVEMGHATPGYYGSTLGLTLVHEYFHTAYNMSDLPCYIVPTTTVPTTTTTTTGQGSTTIITTTTSTTTTTIDPTDPTQWGCMYSTAIPVSGYNAYEACDITDTPSCFSKCMYGRCVGNEYGAHSNVFEGRQYCSDNIMRRGGDVVSCIDRNIIMGDPLDQACPKVANVEVGGPFRRDDGYNRQYVYRYPPSNNEPLVRFHWGYDNDILEDGQLTVRIALSRKRSGDDVFRLVSEEYVSPEYGNTWGGHGGSYSFPIDSSFVQGEAYRISAGIMLASTDIYYAGKGTGTFYVVDGPPPPPPPPPPDCQEDGGYAFCRDYYDNPNAFCQFSEEGDIYGHCVDEYVPPPQSTLPPVTTTTIPPTTTTMPTTTTTIETPTTTTTTEPYVPDDDTGDDDCTETDVTPACVHELISGPTPAAASAPDHQFQA